MSARRWVAWLYTGFLGLFFATGEFDVVLGFARGARHLMAQGGDLMLGTVFCWIIGALAYGALRWVVALVRWRPFEREIAAVREDVGDVFEVMGRVESALTARAPSGPHLHVVR